MSQNQHQSGSSNSNISVSEVYWALVAKADKKFSKIRDLPFYQRTRFIFCRAVLFLHSQFNKKIEFVPECMPRLAEVVSPLSSVVAQLADIFDATDRFMFRVTTLLPC